MQTLTRMPTKQPSSLFPQSYWRSHSILTHRREHLDRKFQSQVEVTRFWRQDLPKTSNQFGQKSLHLVGIFREEKGYPLQYYGLGNSMDCIVHGVTKSWTRLRKFTCHLRVRMVDLIVGNWWNLSSQTMYFHTTYLINEKIFQTSLRTINHPCMYTFQKQYWST